ncbi:hypothetical protein [Paenibacillus favisporus]
MDFVNQKQAMAHPERSILHSKGSGKEGRGFFGLGWNLTPRGIFLIYTFR